RRSLCAISTFSPLLLYSSRDPRDLHSFPTRRSSDLRAKGSAVRQSARGVRESHTASRPLIPKARTLKNHFCQPPASDRKLNAARSEEHTSELQSRENLVCRLLLEKKKRKENIIKTM